jgi:hypothetical protein
MIKCSYNNNGIQSFSFGNWSPKLQLWLSILIVQRIREINGFFLKIINISRGVAPGYINISPLGLARGVAPGYINIAPLGLARGALPLAILT